MDAANEIRRLYNHINVLERHVQVLEEKVVKSDARNDNLQQLFQSLSNRVQELEEQHTISFHDDHESHSYPTYQHSHKHSNNIVESNAAKNEANLDSEDVNKVNDFQQMIINDNCKSDRLEWKYLDKKLIPSAFGIYETVNAVILSLTPSRISEVYRESVRSFIAKQIQDVPPGVKIFFQGLHVLDCFLPNDPIRLSLFFWPGHVYKVNWYLSLNEVLTTLAEDGPDDTDEKNADENSDSAMDHTISNIVYSQKTKSLLMQVDEFVDLEIKADNCEEFILLSLVEEFSLLLGKPKLLKDSIILIRAWWFYESKTFLQHKDIKDLLLTDYSLLVMICAVFNQFKDINNPFEAFCCFLGVYSNFDYESHFITFNGIKPFCPINSLSTSPSSYHIPTPDLVLTNEVLMKYWNLHMENMNREEAAKEEGGGGGPTYLEIERASINILHPLKNANKTTYTYNKRKASFIFNCFANGATRMQEALVEASKGNLSNLENLFNKIFLLFRNLRVPDTIIEKCSTLSRPAFVRSSNTIILDELLKQIDFCNLVLHRHLTTNGLLALIKDIIMERGPLPIGEIGKTLNMTSLIKDKFGGLKKFLESYQDSFIISANHAYNPHVFVRSDVDKFEIESIEKGDSAEVMRAIMKSSAKFKTNATNKKKKKSPSEDAPSMNQGSIQTLTSPPTLTILDQRAKSNVIGDRYFPNTDKGTINNNNNIFVGGNYGSNAVRSQNIPNNDIFGQSSYGHNINMMGPRDNGNADIFKSSFLFNNMPQVSNEVRSNYRDEIMSNGGPSVFRHRDEKSPWDIYRTNPNSDAGHSSSSDINFFNNDFNADLSHLMSGTSLSATNANSTSTSNLNNGLFNHWK